MMRGGLTVMVWVVLGLCCFPVSRGTAAEPNEAEALVRRAIDALPRVPFQSRLKLITNEGWVREIVLRHKRVGDAEASYLEVTAPEELRGTRFLFLERPDGQNEQYIKVAASRHAIRVSPQTRRQPFLGSEFYVADLVLPELRRYTFAVAGQTRCLERTCTVVRMVPKDPSQELYARTEVVIDPESLLILGRRFYDAQGRLVKNWVVEEVRTIDGYNTLVRQRMDNVAEKRTSTLEVVDVRYGVELPDEMFTRKYLLRERPDQTPPA